jgi:glutathione S-transferase
MFSVCCGGPQALGVDMSSGKINLYYWPFFPRCAALVRMMEESGVEYEHISQKDIMATKCSAFGATAGVNIAPPVIEDGSKIISQSTACCMYLGKRLGFDKGVDECLAVQYMLDMVDLFEGGLGKNNEDAANLKKFLEGADGNPSRFSVMAGPVERNIKGPFFFGAEPSYVDFFLLQHMDWRQDMFEKLKAKTGTDFLANYPKMVAATAGLRALKSYGNYKGPCKYGAFSEEIIDAYSKL